MCIIVLYNYLMNGGMLKCRVMRHVLSCSVIDHSAEITLNHRFYYYKIFQSPGKSLFQEYQCFKRAMSGSCSSTNFWL